ncbi:MAG: hydroxymethylpyrimidine/phosphomethylpyrimidine kinase, partial [Candidatus Micrarchaeota archaeon]|nr:hydroxymethylpyrimidine/phosphomethylpyrimidine kinase [Candidatus Micrarchaeota archaeon]
VLDDLDIEVIKFGVVPDKEYFKVFEKKCKGIPFVLDPVMVAEADSFSFVKEKETLSEMARNRDCLIITPNLIEAERLTDVKITDTSTCLAAINQFKRLKIKNAVIKGIRYSENELCDVYYDSNLPDLKYFVKERKPFRYHGSGCCFASAIAAFYYLCRDIQNSVVLAEDFIQRAIFRAEKIGKGEVLVVMP